MIGSGRLDQRVVFERPSGAQDGAGAVAPDFAPVVELWANVRPVRGRERVAAGEAFHEADVVVSVRRHPLLAGLNPAWRLQHAGRIHNIVAVADVDSRGLLLEITTTTGANAG